ncbi:hypothetical protein INR49_017957 [Caranx melampygus]|nr:hypothetical protein INR49_017957 [Caranx melampygus]
MLMGTSDSVSIRARFQYAEVQEGQEHQQEEVLEEVRLAIPTPYRSDAPTGHDADPGGGGRDEDEDEVEEMEGRGRGRRRRRRGSSCSGHGEGGGEWSPEVHEHEEQELELEVEVGRTLGVRITAPIRDPDCVSEEEEQQPYPALSPMAFFCLKQTTRPRNWCLRVVCNPYPFMCGESNPVWPLELDGQIDNIMEFVKVPSQDHVLAIRVLTINLPPKTCSVTLIKEIHAENVMESLSLSKVASDKEQ